MTRIALALGLVCFAMPALAACPSPLTGKDAAGATQNFGITVDGSGNCYGNVALVDGTNAANKAAVTAAGALKVDNSGVTQPSNVTQFGGSNIVAATAGVPRFGLADGSGNAVTSQSANSHVAPDVVINDASGNRLNGLTTGTAGTASTQVLSVQGIASMTPLNTTLGAETTKVIGTVRVQGNVGGVMDAAVAGTYPANALAVGVLNGSNIGRLVGDETNGLWVNVKAGSAGNGAASATGSAVPAQAGYTGVNVGGTLRGWTGVNPTGTVYAGQSDLASVNGVSLGSPSAYGTSPGAVNVPGVNAFVTNALTSVNDNSDAVAVATPYGSPVVNHNYCFNGTSWDRCRSTKGSLNVVNGGSTYQHVAASQTAAVLQTSTGAAGDYLSHCVIYPSTTAAGSVTVFDNANAAATNVIEFTTGTLSNLAPISIPVGAISTAGAWKVTTGANETVVCYGKFS